MARLLDVLRQQLHLTGTKEGCGEGECGACAVLIDGELVNSCLTPVLQVQGASMTTIEGVANGEQLHAVQEAFIAHGGAQCGICTPGMILAAVTPAATPSGGDRRRDSRRAGRQPVPLHRLHEDLRSGAAGVGAGRAAGSGHRRDLSGSSVPTPHALLPALVHVCERAPRSTRRWRCSPRSPARGGRSPAAPT